MWSSGGQYFNTAGLCKLCECALRVSPLALQRSKKHILSTHVCSGLGGPVPDVLGAE